MVFIFYLLPLIHSLDRIMFMREFRVLSPAASPSQVPALKAQDLESFGGPFAPEFLYDVLYEAMRNHKSFAHMRVSLVHICYFA